MKLKHSAILVTPFLLLTLAGCSGTKDSSSSQKSAPEETYPSTKSIKLAVKKATKSDEGDLVLAGEHDASLRFSDITKFPDADKYAGKVKQIAGEVFDVESTKSKDGKMYYIEDAANNDHVYVIYTNKTGVRKDDTLSGIAVVAGKMTYTTSNNRTEKAVLVAAKKSNIQNNGAVGK